ncbi:MAG: CpXC domain-containing protein [Alphaproteobacteria bacterium]|nr:CpXC domain-containing protein [Alphaproteobacteria bacterium]
MSTFHPRTIRCPACGATTTRMIAVSINGPRRPDVVDAAKAGVFQRFTCTQCGAGYQVDHPMVYLDFEKGLWIAMYPARWEQSWRHYENEPRDDWRRNMIVNAPPLVRSMSGKFRIRAVFGLDALGDKLACLDGGLDDVFLELLKLDLMRSTQGLVFHPARRPRLREIHPDRLVFFVAGGADGATPPHSMEVPRSRYAALAANAVEWAAGMEAVSGGPYIDVGRALIPGDAEPDEDWAA